MEEILRTRVATMTHKTKLPLIIVLREKGGEEHNQIFLFCIVFKHSFSWSINERLFVVHPRLPYNTLLLARTG